MSGFVLVSGTLFRNPESRVSKTGQTFLTATIRVKEGEEGSFWNVVVFSDAAITELMRLREGEKLSVQGRLRIEEYEKGSEKRVSLSCIADHVLALRQPPKQREKKGCLERFRSDPAFRRASQARI